MFTRNLRKVLCCLAGTEIVRISPKDYKIAIAQAEANIRSAETQLQELDVTKQNNKAALAIEEKSLAIKKQELNRKKTLLQRGTLAQASVDQEQRDVLAQEKRVVDLKSAIRLIPVQKLTQQQQLDVNKTQLETAKLNLERTRIMLPFGARISQANVEVTQYVGVGTTLGSADGIKIAEVEAQFPLRDLSQLLRFLTKIMALSMFLKTPFKSLRKTLDCMVLYD